MLKRAYVGLARLRVWHGNINNENTSGHQEEPNVELDDDVDIADDMMLANGIEQAVEDAGAERSLSLTKKTITNYIGRKMWGRRGYSWWTTATKDRSDTIPHFVKAVRLVALSQISSAAVERVFSQLTFIH
mmetsp:Transcript_15982/g.24872  ORF Transcript_15982/g.24872 Transcript_15982/m.24872 type:complete len:131 (+) Transcript_15982:183-575(+)